MNRYSVVIVCVILVLLLQLWGGGIVPGTSPVPGQGFHLLIVEDASQRDSLPAGQKAAMFSGDVRDRINRAGGRRYLMDRDDDVRSTNDEWLIKAMRYIEGKPLPHYVVDNDGRGEAGPLQKTAAEHEAVVRKYLK